jgi:hypothetical protein
MNTSVRELLNVKLRDEARGLPIGVQAAGWAVYLVPLFALQWAGSAIDVPYGAVAGLALGLLLGTYMSTKILRCYRAPHQPQE